jgi:predicted Zn-dependent peptidase
MINPFFRIVSLLALVVALNFLFVSAVHAQVTAITLDNGLRIITAESHVVPIVAVDAWVRAGTRREKPGQPAVAHFLEHLLFKGTPTHPDEESVDGTIEDLGGTLDAATSYDWAHFYTEVPASGASQAIALIGDILEHASLKASSVEEERPIILDEISRDNDDPLASLTVSARGLFYTPNSAYSKSITGTIDQAKAVTREQILDFYNTYYVPNNITIVVSGDVTPAEVQKAVSDQLGTWKKSTSLPEDSQTQRSAYQTPAEGQPTVRKSLVQKDANESYAVYAFAAPSVKDQPDAWNMDVLLTLLGQGGNNRLTTDLKIKTHLVDTVATDFLTQKDPGILTISVSMPTENIDSAQDEIMNEIQELRTNPVSAGELAAAKNGLRANYLFDVDTDSGRADSLGFYDTIDTYQYDVDYLKHIAGVTAADVQRAAQKYLDPNDFALVLQVPPSDVSTARANEDGASLILAADKAASN